MDVNVNAYDEYYTVLERYEFLRVQHDDLVEAEKTLTKIIEELDIAMRKQFKDKFNQIGNEFDKVFKEFMVKQIRLFSNIINNISFLSTKSIIMGPR